MRFTPPMPIVVGAPRSGTTLLRFMLDAHPDLAIPPETGFLALVGPGMDRPDELFRTVVDCPPGAPAWADFGVDAESYREALARIEPFSAREGVLAFYRLYAARFGKRRWGDKTPTYARHMPSIAALLPEAHFIHLVRDGRDVAASWRKMWFSPGNDVETLAASWRDLVATARDQGRRCPRYVEVSFEELVLSPRPTLERLCRYLDLPYDEAMARYFERVPDRLREHRSRYRSDGTLLVSHEQRLWQQRNAARPPDPSLVFAWKREMSDDERARFEAVAGEQLLAFGYEAGP